MTWAPAIMALRAHIKTNVTFPPLAWQNESFIKPKGPWALVRFIGGANGWRATGTGNTALYAHDGLVHVLIHMPRNSGVERAAQLADSIGAYLKTAKIAAPSDPNYVRTDAPRVDHDVAENLDGIYDVTLLSVPFTYYHFS